MEQQISKDIHYYYSRSRNSQAEVFAHLYSCNRNLTNYEVARKKKRILGVLRVFEPVASGFMQMSNVINDFHIQSLII